MGKVLPTPMLPERFAAEFIDLVSSTESGDQVGLATMEFEAQLEPEASLVFDVLESMVQAKTRGVDVQLLVDERYVRRMTRIGNRVVPNWLPLMGAEDRRTRHENHARTASCMDDLRDTGIVIDKKPQRPDRGYTPALRHLGSLHIAQRALAVVHTKAAWVSRPDSETTAWLNTGNLTDADLTRPNSGQPFGMNNLSLRFEDRQAAFIVRAATGNFGRIAGTHMNGAEVKLIHDIGNSGAPGRLPSILEEALTAIDPRREAIVKDPYDAEPKEPKTVVLLSQYAPNGLLASVLKYAADQGTEVYVPRQPADDHRSRNFPYNVNNALFRARSIGNQPRRPVPSHIKTQIVTYHDGTAKLIVGSDNLVTNLQKIVRNEELAVAIDLNLKDKNDDQYFAGFVDLLREMDEIDATIQEKLTSKA
ncbi:MAG TPA: hypothetical protein VG604_03110 [Candidatus Saccharimonadales bacterium]|nr:hypothetical protein [Candidatus Saccharimonadales bacterium]